MNTETVAELLKQLGHPIRLNIFRILIRYGNKGLAVGVLQTELNIPGSTLSHHINKMVSTGLISQKREGRTLFCFADKNKINAITDFLVGECCLSL